MLSTFSVSVRTTHPDQCINKEYGLTNAARSRLQQIICAAKCGYKKVWKSWICCQSAPVNEFST